MDLSVAARPAALLEREHEIERLRAALRAVGQRAGVTLVIEGGERKRQSRNPRSVKAEANRRRLRFRGGHTRGQRVRIAGVAALTPGEPLCKQRPVDRLVP
jgi:hypothetical protein